ncbi:MAG: hypothetical protein L0Y80_10165 [Ignavibacteriae bacterium]|nr:hypothetical protein [Ignavibacteriota bacterium]
MKHRGRTYRAWAIGFSVIVHVVVLMVASLLIIDRESKTPEYITIEILRRDEQPLSVPKSEPAPAGRSRQRTAKPKAIMPRIELPPPPADVPVLSPDEPVAVNELELIDRAFFGDSLYAIIKAAPHLKPLVLRNMLTENVPTTDTLETLRKQLAEAMQPYINMSDAERQARFHMKLFGSPTNPMRPGSVPGNIPITDIIRAIIELLK